MTSSRFVQTTTTPKKRRKTNEASIESITDFDRNNYGTMVLILNRFTYFCTILFLLNTKN